MQDNLLGYVLNALDENTQLQVEAYLEKSPEARASVEKLRQCLEPLASAREEFEPPLSLRYSTLALVAESRCQKFHPAPKAPPVRSIASPSRSWWRRADVLAAACLLILLMPLSMYGITRLQHQQRVLACQNNLRGFGTALIKYSDFHDGKFPQVEKAPPRNVAGVFIPILYEAELGPDLSVVCPGNGKQVPLAEVGPEWRNFLEVAAQSRNTSPSGDPKLMSCYAYTLGYRNADGTHVGLVRNLGNTDRIPIMADKPPFPQMAGICTVNDNSLNHGGEGQNVLFVGGHVEFCRTRTVGVDGDDIYTNRNNEVQAGLDALDTVLGSSDFRSYLSGERR